MTDVSEQEVEAATNALCGFRFPRAVKDPRILELIRAEARAALTAAAQVRERAAKLAQVPPTLTMDMSGAVRPSGLMPIFGATEDTPPKGEG